MLRIMRDLRANQDKSQPERDGIAKFAETESRFPRRKARHVNVTRSRLAEGGVCWAASRPTTGAASARFSYVASPKEREATPAFHAARSREAGSAGATSPEGSPSGYHASQVL